MIPFRELLPSWSPSALVAGVVLSMLILAYRLKRIRRGRTVLIFHEPVQSRG
jgi:hypothetical protein